MKDYVAEKHLKFFELAESKFSSFKDDVYCKKQTYLSDTIKMFKLLPLNFISTCNAPTSSKAISLKEIKVAEKLLNIASKKCRGKRNALQYD